MKKIIQSFNYAVEGVIHCLKTQTNMRIHFAVAITVLVLSLFFDFSRLELALLFFTIALVIIAEMINTSIETVVDLYTNAVHPLAKIAKDVAAGAVLIAALNAIVVGYLLFFSRIDSLTTLIFQRIRETPLHVTFICIILIVILSIVGKALIGKQQVSLLQGGVVSGHTAVAFSLAMAASFIAQNALIMTLCFLLALLVAESRIEGNFHSVFETLMGALLGIFFTLLIFQFLYNNPW